MNIKFFMALGLGVLILACSSKVTTKPSSEVPTPINNISMDTLSYSLGLLVAQNLKQQGLNKVSSADVADGIQDVISGAEPKLSLEEANQIFSAHMQKQQEEAHSGNVEEGKAFLMENAKKEGVTSLDSGLQYEVITAGTGASPGPTDKVTTHYHGTLLDGTVFDSSVERGQPASFPVNGVIMGWQEALQLMKVGSKWRLFVPHQLAYGERGAGGAIGPFATLIFEVELISID